MGLGRQWKYNLSEPGEQNGDGNEPFKTGVSGSEKTIRAHLQHTPNVTEGDDVRRRAVVCFGIVCLLLLYWLKISNCSKSY